MVRRGRSRLARLALWLHHVEDGLLILMLAAMIALAAGQILLRNVFDAAFIWGDQVLRILVLWVAMLGAVVASRDDRHINIDLLSRYLGERTLAGVKTVLYAFTVCVSTVIAWQAARMVESEREFPIAPPIGGVPAWVFQAIIPVAFALIAWRYLLLFVTNLQRLARRGDAT
ncbi:MAG TPA: TRAP transporter small permease [Gammaproteobacteria bacterium]|nr:TRAP transporter small permease [Gammaproteobacteria bacterium]